MGLCPEDQTNLYRAKQSVLNTYGSDPNVTGVGIGFRRRAGELTTEPSVVVLVGKKRRPALVSRRRLLPSSIEVDGMTYGVDVIQAGPFSSGAETALAPGHAPTAPAVISDTIRPARAGSSISNLADGKVAGTLGLFVIDNTDGTVCILSCNHVMARMGRGKVGDSIIQPGGYDGGQATDKIATLKRWAPISTSGTTIDAAIAQLTDQSNYSLSMAHDLMAGVSTSHPVVGIVTAGDSFGGCLLTRMDLALNALNVSLPLGQTAAVGKKAVPPFPCANSGGSSDGLADPQPGMNIEKVGRTTEYTSSVIIAIGVSATVTTPIGDVPYNDLIYTEFFDAAGDSGSAVFAGGNGNTLVPPTLTPPCLVLGTLGTYYNLPLTADNPTVDQVRDEFFLQTPTGRLLVELTYVNSQELVTRLQGQVGSSDEQSYAKQYYTKYHDFMVNVLNNPNSTAVVTQENLDDASNVIGGLEQTVLNEDESTLGWLLYEQALVPILGLNRSEALAYMSNPALYETVYNAVAGVPSIEMNSPFKIQPPEPTT